MRTRRLGDFGDEPVGEMAALASAGAASAMFAIAPSEGGGVASGSAVYGRGRAVVGVVGVVVADVVVAVIIANRLNAGRLATLPGRNFAEPASANAESW